MNNIWPLNSEDVPFIHLLLAEIGSITHLDRFTIFKVRPNRMKGSIFGGHQAVELNPHYGRMSQDEQLQAVKEMGMVFTYFNRPEIFQSFCVVYEAVYHLMGQFDTWYSQQGGAGFTAPSLQAGWKAYMKEVLSSLVNRNRKTFDALYATWRRSGSSPAANALLEDKWVTNKFTNKALIRVSGTCPNLT
ncbi:hypothetical protein B0I37DRAFT_240554 [Chaetomium sp. MPI-CAGE-AT-0009]|nr:hypothetical protein B0I37DRAFT_240554 [Chaetomium sp. MPI-CAGE-AT-0009]